MTEHYLDGFTGAASAPEWTCSCGWRVPLGESILRAFDRHLTDIRLLAVPIVEEP